VTRPSRHFQACLWLLFGTMFWGVSFTLIKSIRLVQEQLLPGAGSWFLSSLAVSVRFGCATLPLFLWTLPTLRRLTRRELEQGAGLGLFGGVGLLLQVDGMAYTTASTSAFLTQFYCLLIPVWVALRQKKFPRPLVLLSSALVLAGVALLSGFNWQELRLGRGEAETILATVFFTGQILWLERPVFSSNRSAHTSLVMYAVSALLFLPLALASAPTLGACVTVFSSWPVIGMMLALVVGCTLLAYGLMNHWQPSVTATEAGVIYCVEPLYASLFALYLPAWLSTWAGIDYANEKLTPHLLLGGGLITLANILIQTRAAKPAA